MCSSLPTPTGQLIRPPYWMPWPCCVCLASAPCQSTSVPEKELQQYSVLWHNKLCFFYNGWDETRGWANAESDLHVDVASCASKIKMAEWLCMIIEGRCMVTWPIIQIRCFTKLQVKVARRDELVAPKCHPEHLLLAPPRHW